MNKYSRVGIKDLEDNTYICDDCGKEFKKEDIIKDNKREKPAKFILGVFFGIWGFSITAEIFSLLDINYRWYLIIIIPTIFSAQKGVNLAKILSNRITSTWKFIVWILLIIVVMCSINLLLTYLDLIKMAS